MQIPYHSLLSTAFCFLCKPLQAQASAIMQKCEPLFTARQWLRRWARADYSPEQVAERIKGDTGLALGWTLYNVAGQIKRSYTCAKLYLARIIWIKSPNLWIIFRVIVVVTQLYEVVPPDPPPASGSVPFPFP